MPIIQATFKSWHILLDPQCLFPEEVGLLKLSPFSRRWANIVSQPRRGGTKGLGQRVCLSFLPQK